jgi:hypothetical protein
MIFKLSCSALRVRYRRKERAVSQVCAIAARAEMIEDHIEIVTARS